MRQAMAAKRARRSMAEIAADERTSPQRLEAILFKASRPTARLALRNPNIHPEAIDAYLNEGTTPGDMVNDALDNSSHPLWAAIRGEEYTLFLGNLLFYEALHYFKQHPEAGPFDVAEVIARDVLEKI